LRVDFNWNQTHHHNFRWWVLPGRIHCMLNQL
jgi:hypothetical protein